MIRPLRRGQVKPAFAMPLDDWMPAWDARSRHAVHVAAPAGRVYEVLVSADFGRHAVVRVLMAARTLPAVLSAPRQAVARWRARETASQAGPTAHLLGGAFVVLENRPPTGLILGLTGRFWAPTGGLIPTDPSCFRDPPPAGTARAAWGFHVEPVTPEHSRLSTETRVACADPRTRRVFLRYWRVIRPGSGLIRWALLRQIKREAERLAA